MRVLLALHHARNPDSGAPGTTLRLGDSLSALGCDVRYAFYDEVFGDGRETNTSLLRFPWALAKYLRRLEATWTPDIVDAAVGDAWLAARRLLHRNTVLVARSHGLEPLYFRELRGGAARLSLRARFYHGGYRLWEVGQSIRSAHHLIVPNAREASFAEAQYGISAERISVMPYPIDGSFFRSRDRKPGKVKLITVGPMTAMKGGSDLVAAMSLIAASDDFMLTVVGGAQGFSGEQTLRQYLGDRLRIVSNASNREVDNLLGEHDVFVCPSRWEAGPLSVFEAAASGLTIVSTNVGAVSDRFKDGVNAVLVAPGQPAVLADALRRVIGDAKLRGRLASGVREVAAPYAAETAARATLDLYEKLRA